MMMIKAMVVVAPLVAPPAIFSLLAACTSQTDNKLYNRGVGISQVPEILQWLYELRDICEKEGLDDSNLLDQSLRPPPPYTIPIDPEKSDRKPKEEE